MTRLALLTALAVAILASGEIPNTAYLVLQNAPTGTLIHGGCVAVGIAALCWAGYPWIAFFGGLGLSALVLAWTMFWDLLVSTKPTSFPGPNQGVMFEFDHGQIIHYAGWGNHMLWYALAAIILTAIMAPKLVRGRP